MFGRKRKKSEELKANEKIVKRVLLRNDLFLFSRNLGEYDSLVQGGFHFSLPNSLYKTVDFFALLQHLHFFQSILLPYTAQP